MPALLVAFVVWPRTFVPPIAVHIDFLAGAEALPRHQVFVVYTSGSLSLAMLETLATF